MIPTPKTYVRSLHFLPILSRATADTEIVQVPSSPTSASTAALSVSLTFRLLTTDMHLFKCVPSSFPLLSDND